MSMITLVSITSIGHMKLPNTFDAITELKVLSATEMVDVLMGNFWLAFLAVVGVIGWAFVHLSLPWHSCRQSVSQP